MLNLDGWLIEVGVNDLVVVNADWYAFLIPPDRNVNDFLHGFGVSSFLVQLEFGWGVWGGGFNKEAVEFRGDCDVWEE